MGPQVLHPDPAPGGLGDLLAQLLAVGAHNVLDVRSYQVREDGMRKVVVVRADQEQVELAVKAVLAVVVDDGGVETFLVVPGYGCVHVLLGRSLDVLTQGRVGAREYEAVVENREDPAGFFLFRGPVDAAPRRPVSVTRGVGYQLMEG